MFVLFDGDSHIVEAVVAGKSIGKEGDSTYALFSNGTKATMLLDEDALLD